MEGIEGSESLYYISNFRYKLRSPFHLVSFRSNQRVSVIFFPFFSFQYTAHRKRRPRRKTWSYEHAHELVQRIWGTRMNGIATQSTQNTEEGGLVRLSTVHGYNWFSSDIYLCGASLREI